jgi:hypothetical protein
MTVLLKRISLVLGLAGLLVGASGPGRAQAISPSKDEITYRIRAGDSLIALSRKYFVSPDSYKAVERLNGLTDPDSLRIGSTIVIPTGLLKFTRLEAIVIAFKGSASVASGPRSALVTLQTRLSEGALIETGADGFLTMQLANGSKISLPSNSRLRIARMRTYLLTGGADLDFLVERGRSETTATPLRDSRSRFRMRTPVAVSAVRGTVFRIGYDGPDAPSLTEVVEGNVAVSLATTGAQTNLPGGFGAAGSPDGQLKREELLPPPQFAAGFAQQRGRTVAFALEPDVGAVGYLVQVAKDRAFIDLVGSASAVQPSVALGDLPAGNYFVRAMAIAPSGLIGMPRTLPFERKLRSLIAQQVLGAAQRWQLDWDLGDGGVGTYRVQVFSADQPNVPIIDEPALTANALTVQGLPTGTYTWRVGQMQPIAGQLQETWTEPERFTVGK